MSVYIAFKLLDVAFIAFKYVLSETANLPTNINESFKCDFSPYYAYCCVIVAVLYFSR